MSRSKWKSPYTNIEYLKKSKNNKKQQIAEKVNRNSEIVPNFIGKNFKIHNGKTYSELSVTLDHIGHKFGEFSFTRSKYVFKKKKVKK
jgi:small subunit ribosomal protein S19